MDTHHNGDSIHNTYYIYFLHTILHRLSRAYWGGIMVQYQVLCQAHIVNFT